LLLRLWGFESSSGSPTLDPMRRDGDTSTNAIPAGRKNPAGSRRGKTRQLRLRLNRFPDRDHAVVVTAAQAGEVLIGRMLGPYPRGSRFDSDRRLCLLDAKSEGSFTCKVTPHTFVRCVLEQMHGPEALTVERPVETRQEEIRALLGPLIDASVERSACCVDAASFLIHRSRVRIPPSFGT
jgi:hypothetical protein